MRYIVTGIVLASVAGCSWFGGDSREANKDNDRTKVGYSSYELNGQAGAPQGAIDPVSGDWVPRETAHKATYESMTYYFASKDNMETFERRPHEFVTADGYLRKPLDEVRREAEVK
jgi:YHS domain-containing protein